MSLKTPWKLDPYRVAVAPRIREKIGCPFLGTRSKRGSGAGRWDFPFCDVEDREMIVNDSISLGMPGTALPTPQRKLNWITSKQSGIAKILYMIELFGLSDVVQRAMEGTGETEADIKRWVRAFKECVSPAK